VLNKSPDGQIDNTTIMKVKTNCNSRTELVLNLLTAVLKFFSVLGVNCSVCMENSLTIKDNLYQGKGNCMSMMMMICGSLVSRLQKAYNFVSFTGTVGVLCI